MKIKSHVTMHSATVHQETRVKCQIPRFNFQSNFVLGFTCEYFGYGFMRLNSRLFLHNFLIF